MRPSKTCKLVFIVALFAALPIHHTLAVDSFAEGYVSTRDRAVDNVFAITGNKAKQVLLIGLGPTLSDSGSGSTLDDPRIQLFRIDGDGTETVIAGNDNWIEHSTADAVARAVEDLNLDRLDELEAGIVKTLQPGSYRLRVFGVPAGKAEGFASVGLVLWSGDLGGIEQPGQIRSGVWSGVESNYEVCFHVNASGTALTARGSECPDRDAMDIDFDRGMTGACDDGHFSWDKAEIPINGNHFTKSFNVPYFGYGPRVSLKAEGTFKNGVLTGTFTKKINGRTCSGTFVALPN
ncbi:hypothetical protein BST95_08245 [Halioglobus japonicus]|uniref:Uncharacterized protein n=1 Tax=Halioglobus japonicus TaxID=930805 RepID=A0AAP8ME93_9GAMM|nr:hypothetical protein BST95_08245 [Halioglobus japonicus]PLW86231.1 hypothetical protein C0029_07295 [Halioglobus japonicus]GHD13800.1 hypothetical protein GCM10007052_16670 [Halioglobus japonicus]